MCAAVLQSRTRQHAGIFSESTVDAWLLLESELQQLSGTAWSRRSRGARAAAGTRPETADRRVDRGAKPLSRRAAQFAAADALRFMPALNVTREEISEMIECSTGY